LGNDPYCPGARNEAEQLISDAATLPVSDRLIVAQAIWDSLPVDAHPATGPEIKTEFDRRML